MLHKPPPWTALPSLEKKKNHPIDHSRVTGRGNTATKKGGQERRGMGKQGTAFNNPLPWEGKLPFQAGAWAPAVICKQKSRTELFLTTAIFVTKTESLDPNCWRKQTSYEKIGFKNNFKSITLDGSARNSSQGNSWLTWPQASSWTS